MIAADLLRSHPDLTKAGISHRYESMIDDIERWHRQGF
jgi:hypothetical protein